MVALQWIYDCLTRPAFLFILLNLVVGTIVVISRRGGVDGGGVPKLSRSTSSFVLDRFRSLSLYRSRYAELQLDQPELPPPLPSAPAAGSEAGPPAAGGKAAAAVNKLDYQTGLNPTAASRPRVYSRSASCTESLGGGARRGFDGDREAAPTTTSVVAPEEEAGAAPAAAGGVDERADDFISRFRQQLRLQRLDSIMRYKEMIGRGK